MIDITKFSKNGLSKIKDSTLLDTNDFSTINELSQELQRVFEVKQVFRTETEMRYSVLNDLKFPTISSKYWQSIREQNVFFTNLVYLSCDYEEKQGELELLEIDLEEIDLSTKRGNAKLKIKKAQIKKLQFNLQEMKIEAHDRVREINLWEEIKEELKSLGKFDINNVNTNQKESLTIKYQNELEIAKVSGNHDLFKNASAGYNTITKNQISD
jgi:hypothetical protein